MLLVSSIIVDVALKFVVCNIMSVYKQTLEPDFEKDV